MYKLFSKQLFFLNPKSTQIQVSKAGENLKETVISPPLFGFVTKSFKCI